MNSALRQTARVTQRRFKSTGTSTTFLTKKPATTKKAWLSDPSTFPLIGIMGLAAALVVGVGVGNIFYSPDVQIDPNKRGAIMRTW